MIMTLVGPTVTDNTRNGIMIGKMKSHQDSIDKRLEEIEFVYKKVCKNASA